MFSLAEDQRLLRGALDHFFRDNAGSEWTAAKWRRLADELGILAAPFSEENGGTEGGALAAIMVMEALGEHLCVHPYLETVIMCGRLIEKHGGEHRRSLVESIASGECILALAHRESWSPEPGKNNKLLAIRQSDGRYRLEGKKIMVRSAPWASHLVVSAQVEDENASGDALSLFLIERDRAGLSYANGSMIDGYTFADIGFDAVAVGLEDIIGPRHGGARLLASVIDEGAVALCAEGVGVMHAMISQTLLYLKQRKQFGQTLSSFQALQHRLVDMQMAFERSVSMVFAAAASLDSAPGDRRMMASAAKFLVGRALNLVAREAVQMHGAIGLMEETPIARYFKRATVIQSQCGDTASHLNRFSAQAGVTLYDQADANGEDFIARMAHGATIGDGGAAFRADVREFIERNFSPEIQEAASWETGAFSSPHATKEWQRRLAARGWAAPAWPTEFGGPGWPAQHRRIFEEELAKVGAPRLPAMGLQMCAPVLMRFGTEEQKSRFLPRILSGEDFWCQGYSEPNAGSDLAAVQLRAARAGDEYVLNGSKIWTTFAQFANWIFVLARTSAGGKPQAGISFILVPMDSPGISVRPFISMSGEHEVNQVFFDDVRVPVSNRVGDENDGWRVAKYLLEFERGVGHQVPALVVDLQRTRDAAMTAAGEDGAALWKSTGFRLRFSELEIQTLAIRLTEDRLIYSLPVGQSVGDMAASLMKLSWSETGQEILELLLTATGPRAATDQRRAYDARNHELIMGPADGHATMRRYLNDRVLTVAGGSSEVQRNILARVLLNA